MGVILDSSVVIAAERRDETPSALLTRIKSVCGDQEAGLSAIGYTELVHGIWRKDTPERRKISRNFLDEVVSQLPVYSYTQEIAEIAGRIDSEQRMAGSSIPFADLLIGATALSLGFAMLTANVRHFRLIPGLDVMSF